MAPSEDVAPPTPSPVGFNSLPPELRYMIWQLALPGPRDIHIWPTVDCQNRLKRKYLKTKIVHPTLLFINQESRALALRKYVVILGPNSFSIALDVHQDTIYVMSPNLQPRWYPTLRREVPVEKSPREYAAYYNLTPSDNAGALKLVFADGPRPIRDTRRNVRNLGEPPTIPRDDLENIRLRECTFVLSNLGSDLATFLRSLRTSAKDHFAVTQNRFQVNGTMVSWEGRLGMYHLDRISKNALMKFKDDPFCVADRKPTISELEVMANLEELAGGGATHKKNQGVKKGRHPMVLRSNLDGK